MSEPTITESDMALAGECVGPCVWAHDDNVLKPCQSEGCVPCRLRHRIATVCASARLGGARAMQEAAVEVARANRDAMNVAVRIEGTIRALDAEKIAQEGAKS